ncbi:PQQ-binding-like beta-propeller repeat protein [Nocardioides dongxiaopingii]|uniref:outer membrane protein assembly factor BamB family protein n=1 Tax=Nocardioides dongxiaopingii TaxID=2576036 RepID=UPI0010C76B65|nr:PQQ-binding-like beta-propeller repeat protein [Nocardioides dongxiaopingii]
MPRRSRATAAAVLALALMLTACTGDDEPDPATSSGPTPPTLEPVWQSDPADLPDGGVEDVVLDAGLIVRVASAEVVVHDRATGGLVSRWSPPRGTICHASATLGDDDTLGVVLSDRRRGCRTAVALDVRTGTLRWQAALYGPGEQQFTGGLVVAVTDRTLVVQGECGGVWRRALADGRELDRLAPGGAGCYDQESTIAGDRVAISHRVERASGDRVELGLYDVDSGRSLWTRTVPDQFRTSVEQLDLVDPRRVLLSASSRNVVTTRAWDAEGRPGPAIGKSALARSSTRDLGYVEVVGRLGDLVVTRYPDSADPDVLRGHDLRTGAEVWELVPPGAGTEGHTIEATVDDDRLVVAVGVDEHTDLLGYDLLDPGTPQVLGRVPGPGVRLDGDLVLAGSAAYLVPEDGEEREYRPDTPARLGDWSPGDVRPEDAVDACEAAGEQTPALLGFRPDDVPPPSDCTWYRYAPRGGGVVMLRVEVEVFAPRRKGDGTSMPAVDVTEELVDYYRGTVDGDLPSLADGSHPGDAAWGSFDIVRGDRFGYVPAAMVTRWRNVVVRVAGGSTSVGPYDPAVVRDALTTGTEAVLDQLGSEG